MKHEDEMFLRAGLTHYSAAFNTVEEFTARIRQRLAAALQRRWPGGKASAGHRSRVPANLYLEASRAVTLRDGSEASVSAGIGWENEKPYLFVYCGDGPEWAMRPADERFEADGSVKFLSKHCDPTDTDFDIDASLDAAIDDWENAVNPPGSTAAAVKRKVSARVQV